MKSDVVNLLEQSKHGFKDEHCCVCSCKLTVSCSRVSLPLVGAQEHGQGGIRHMETLQERFRIKHKTDSD